MASSERPSSGLLDAALRHRVVLAAIFLGVMAIAVVITLLMPKQYESRMTLVVQNASAQRAASGGSSGLAAKPDGPAYQRSAQDMMETEVNSEVELLTGEDLLQHLVVFRASLDPDESAPEDGSKEMAAAEIAMSNRLHIDPVPKSMVIDVSYADRDPRTAQKVLAELSKAYLDKHARLKGTVGASTALDAEAADYDKKLAEAQSELADLQKNNDYTSLSEKKDSLSRGIEEANTSLLRDQASLHSADNQIAALLAKLATVAPRVPVTVQEPVSPATQPSVVAALADLRLRRSQALSRLQPSDPAVRELDEQIARAEAALKQGSTTTKSTTVTESNPEWHSLNQQLNAQQVARSGIVAHIAELQNQLAVYRRSVSHLEDVTPQDDQLQRRVNELRDAAQTFATRRDAARIEQQLQQDKLGVVSVALDPTFSWKPVKPSMLVDCLVGFAAAVVLCLLTMLALEARRETILTPGELEAITGRPVLASIDDIHDIERIFGPANASAAAGELPYPWRESARK